MTQIFSIFGQCDRVAADMMAKKYKLKKIEPKDFPPGVALENELGWPVSFAIVMPDRLVREFTELTATLRA